MIVDATKLKAAIEQAIEEINDACLDLRGQGLQVLLPEAIEFEVRLVTDINAVNRTETDADAGGTRTTTTTQVANDTETQEKSGGDMRTEKSFSAGTETTEIAHPGIQTASSGADNSDEEVDYTYDAG